MAASSAGTEIGAPENLGVKIPDWGKKELWEMKFAVWKSIVWKSCPAKTGMGGRFCQWVGLACHYSGCPRRVFEEMVAFKREIPRPTPTPDFVKEFKTMQNQLGKVQNQLKKTRIELAELKKEA